MTPPLPSLSPPPFSVVYADPPWRVSYAPYPTMRTADIAALPVARLCADDCALFLWAVSSRLPDALTITRAWGFSYTTVAFTWVKRTPRDTGFHLGTGGWTRANPEVCLLGLRGRPVRAGGVPNLVVSPRREHSRKPNEVRGADRGAVRGPAPDRDVRPAAGPRLERVGRRGPLRRGPALRAGR